MPEDFSLPFLTTRWRLSSMWKLSGNDAFPLLLYILVNLPTNKPPLRLLDSLHNPLVPREMHHRWDCPSVTKWTSHPSGSAPHPDKLCLADTMVWNRAPAITVYFSLIFAPKMCFTPFRPLLGRFHSPWFSLRRLLFGVDAVNRRTRGDSLGCCFRSIAGRSRIS